MMAKPMKTLELHYPMIQFLITADIVDAIFVTMDLRAVFVAQSLIESLAS